VVFAATHKAFATNAFRTNDFLSKRRGIRHAELGLIQQQRPARARQARAGPVQHGVAPRRERVGRTRDGERNSLAK
jgi:hypothetical protein